MKTLITIIAVLLPVMAFAEQAKPAPTPEAACSQITDKLQSALADMVNKSVQAAGDAKDFLVKETPDVIRQLLAWKFAESLFRLLFAVVLAVTYSILAIKMFHATSRYIEKNGDTELWFAYGVITIVAGITVLASAVHLSNLDWLQIWIAPKVYLIEYAKTIVSH